MTDTTSIMLHITDIRASTQYQSAVRKIHLATPEDIKGWAAQTSCSEYADLRIAIGIWERIATAVTCMGAEQDKVFPCTPVGLMWEILEPAISSIRATEGSANYASQFEALKGEYECWGRTESGRNFSTTSEQTICALFG